MKHNPVIWNNQAFTSVSWSNDITCIILKLIHIPWLPLICSRWLLSTWVQQRHPSSPSTTRTHCQEPAYQMHSEEVLILLIMDYTLDNNGNLVFIILLMESHNPPCCAIVTTFKYCSHRNYQMHHVRRASWISGPLTGKLTSDVGPALLWDIWIGV